MRKKLKQLGSQKRHTFIGRFERVGYKKSYRYCRPTLLLTHVALAETGELITDHLWLNYTKGFLDLGELLTGDLLRFNGRVASYVKGYFGTSQKLDYKVERPSQVALQAKIEGPRRLLPDTVTKFGRQALIGYIMERERAFYEASCRPIDPYYIEQYRVWLTNHVMKNAQNYDSVLQKQLTGASKNHWAALSSSALGDQGCQYLISLDRWSSCPDWSEFQLAVFRPCAELHSS